MNPNYDDGRGLTGRRLAAYYRAGAVKAEPARVRTQAAVFLSKDQAYAFAFAIMAQADLMFKGETV